MSQSEIMATIEQLYPVTVERRRDFHMYPELGFQENRTAERVAELLRSFNLEVQTGIARTGVVGLLRGALPGKTLLLRADMDALPIQEANNHEYVSRHPGVMHACGHDAHTAILLAVAEALSRYRAAVPGNIKFVFQPAEEGPGGALPMIEAGVLQDPPVNAAMGLHLRNFLAAGQVGIRTGPTLASADQFEITIRGKGGHAAAPHLTVDPIHIAAQVICALHTIVSRQVSPIDHAVITVGTIHGGDKENVIAAQVRLTGTVRTYCQDLRQQMPERIERLVRGITQGFGADYQFDYTPGYPVTVSDASIAAIVWKAAAGVLGPDNVVLNDLLMGGEDMSYFLERVPGCFFFIGSGRSEEEAVPHHSAVFDFDEQALLTGAQVLAAAALAYLNQDDS